MKASKKYENVYAVCWECATENGFAPKEKVVGVWEGVCEICHEKKPCTSLWHDWYVLNEYKTRKQKKCSK